MADGDNDDAVATAAAPPKRRGPLRRLYDWVLGWAETRYGTPALFLVSFTESSFFPIPPDPLLLALAVGKRERALFHGAICTVASVLGGLLGYWIGFGGMEAIGDRVLALYGYEEQFASLSDKFTEYGFLAILAAALTPIPYKVFTIAAGACAMPLPVFLGASLIGRGARFMAEAVLIRIYGARIRDFIDRYFDVLSLVFLVLLVVGFVVVKLFM